MEPDHRFEISAAAGELERHRAAEAIADGGDVRPVSPGFGQQHLEPGATESTGAVRVSPQRPQTSHHFVTIFEPAPTAVIVESKGDEAQLGQLVRATSLVVVESRSFVGDQDGRSLVRSIGEREAPHHGRVLDAVLDVGRSDHRRGSLPACLAVPTALAGPSVLAAPPGTVGFGRTTESCWGPVGPSSNCEEPGRRRSSHSPSRQVSCEGAT